MNEWMNGSLNSILLDKTLGWLSLLFYFFKLTLYFILKFDPTNDHYTVIGNQ